MTGITPNSKLESSQISRSVKYLPQWGVSMAVIAAFEAMFFDVRRRLDARGWIIYQVIGLKPWGPLQPHDVTGAWKYLGLLHGAATVDALVAGADREELDRIGLPAYWSPRSRLPKELQFLLLSRSLPEYGRKALRSLSRITELGLCQLPPYVAPPPPGLSLDMGAESLLDDILDGDASSSFADTPMSRSGEFSRAA